MRKLSMTVIRIISLCLAFVLGFFSAFGAIAGGIYYVYSSVSIDKINEWGEKLGFIISTDDYVDQEADVPITSLSIEDLVLEIQKLSENKLTLDEMITRYGLILPDDIIGKVPHSVMYDIPFATLFSQEGLDEVLKTVTVTEIIDMIPADIASTIISDPARDELSDNTLSDVINMNMGCIFYGIELGYISGVKYEKDTNGEYQVVYADPSNPTMLELIAPLDLGGLADSISKSEDGAALGVIKSSIGDVAVNSLLRPVMADLDMINNVIGEATLGDFIVESSDGTYTLDIMAALEGKKVGTLMGYTAEETTNENGETETTWKDGEIEVTGITALFCDYLLVDLLNGNISFDSMLDDITIGEVLGYSKSSDDGKWYKSGEEFTGIMSSFADLTVNELSDGDKVQGAIEDLKVADVMGYTAKYDDEGNFDHWEDSDGKVTGIMAVLADSKVGELSTKINEVKIGEMLGYTPVYEKDENGEDKIDEEGNKIVDHWVDDNGDQVTGVIGALADASISNLNDRLNEVTVGEVLGFTYNKDNGKWYDGNKVATGVTGALAGTKLNELNNALSTLKVGEVAGYELVYEEVGEGKGNYIKDENNDYIKVNDGEGTYISYWKDSDGNKATGILGALADLTVDQLTKNDTLVDALGDVTLGEALGYTQKDDGKWYEKTTDENGNSTEKELTGIMAALADKPINKMNSAIDDLTLNDVIPGEKTGLLSIIPSDTKISGINDAINNSIKTTPLQFFIDQKLITFSNGTDTTLDYICYQKGYKGYINNSHQFDNNYMLKFTDTSEKYGTIGNYDKYVKNFTITMTVNGSEVTHDCSGYIPSWRTKPLQEAFSYVIDLLSSQSSFSGSEGQNTGNN